MGSKIIKKRGCISPDKKRPKKIIKESYGHMGIKIEKEEDLKPALIEAFSQKDRTVFLDILTDPSENVFPMIPAGGAHCDMLLAGRDEMVSKDETDFNAV